MDDQAGYLRQLSAQVQGLVAINQKLLNQMGEMEARILALQTIAGTQMAEFARLQPNPQDWLSQSVASMTGVGMRFADENIADPVLEGEPPFTRVFQETVDLVCRLAESGISSVKK